MLVAFQAAALIVSLLFMGKIVAFSNSSNGHTTALLHCGQSTMEAKAQG